MRLQQVLNSLEVASNAFLKDHSPVLLALLYWALVNTEAVVVYWFLKYSCPLMEILHRWPLLIIQEHILEEGDRCVHFIEQGFA